jgi:hypothetical protein
MKRKIFHIDRRKDSIEELLYHARELVPHAKSIALVMILDESEDHLQDRIMWYVPVGFFTKTMGLLYGLLSRITNEAMKGSLEEE